MRRKLTPEAIETALATVPNWHLEDGQLVRVMSFSTFPLAIDYVRSAALLAEAASHHPDIDIRYTKLRFSLSTHDAEGLTHNDFTLAAKLDTLFEAK